MRGDAGDAMGKTFWKKFSPTPFQKLSTHWMSEPRLALRFSFWWSGGKRCTQINPPAVQ